MFSWLPSGRVGEWQGLKPGFPSILSTLPLTLQDHKSHKGPNFQKCLIPASLQQELPALLTLAGQTHEACSSGRLQPRVAKLLCWDLVGSAPVVCQVKPSISFLLFTTVDFPETGSQGKS